MGLSTYNRESVEEGLRTVWDLSIGFGQTEERAPAPDMPKAAADPSQGSTILAVRADLCRAWERAPLTTIERRRVFMVYGLGWTNAAAALHEERDKKAIRKSLESGLSKITHFLNRTTEEEEPDDRDDFAG